MEQEVKKRSKKPLVIGLAITGALVIAAVAAVMILPKLSVQETKTKRRDKKPSHKYATEYDVEQDRTTRKDGKPWSIRKYEDGPQVYLSIWNGSHKEEALDYLSFRVYDSASDAKKAYKKTLEYYKSYSDSDVVEGFNWFTGWEPGVCDAFIYEMVYLQDNVIIYADLDIVSAWADDYWYDDDETIETSVPTTTAFDRMSLKDYILDNSRNIQDYVIHDILDY